MSIIERGVIVGAQGLEVCVAAHIKNRKGVQIMCLDGLKGITLVGLELLKFGVVRHIEHIVGVLAATQRITCNDKFLDIGEVVGRDAVETAIT